ncbi:MAG: ABC transporter permease [Chloroflexi bacterium]|nr:ABC transporter permease [Chloroflexota bacterium]
MQKLTVTKPDYWRIVLALAGKDVVDAFKNKTTLTMLIGLLLMMFSVQALPFLLKLDTRSRVAIYDAAQSNVADVLRREGAVQVYETRSHDDAVTVARESSGALLAVSLPEGWDVGTGALMVEGFMVHWVRPSTQTAVVVESERVLTAVTNRPVTIQLQTVYPAPNSGGHTVMVSLGLVLAITMITSILVPYLLLEEKTTRTIDVLRVSPVSIPQIILGKGIAGMVYGVLAAAVLLSFNLSMVNQWGVMVLTVITGTLFGVMVGLLVGIVAENEGTVQLWAGALVVLLIFPTLVGSLTSSNLPQWVQSILNWLPTSAMFKLVRLSFSNAWQPSQITLNISVILVSALIVFGFATWRLNRWE